jgi:hypothetical protein
MYGSTLRWWTAACLVGLLMGGPAHAEAEEPAQDAEEEIDPDRALAESLIGKTYSGDLDLDGWTDYGGGLVSPPIYVYHYQRENGDSLVLVSRLAAKKHTVVDAEIISKPWKGYAISIACTKGDDFTLRFVGDARGTEEKEWWTEVRRAWEIAVPKDELESEDEADSASKDQSQNETAAADAEPKILPGTITLSDTKGVRCTNPNW